ncbi:MAG: aspartyl/asparaginyl beta-hydroxylase domain-containing protein [Rhodospirillales bacterium]
MVATAALDNLRSARRKYVRNFGKPVLRAFDRLMASQSLVPNDPVLDSELFPWVSLLEDNWRDIRAELDAVLRYRDVIPRFQDVSPDQYRISPDDMWKTFMLFGFGFRADLNCQLCPKTTACLERIPGLKTAFFSILAPGKHVPSHKGVTKAFVRCHLGLIVPREREKCLMTVDDVPCVWEEGHAFVFDDTFPHEVTNATDQQRVVLLIDVDRPMRLAGRLASHLAMWLFKKTAYVKDARRNYLQWEDRLRAHLKALEGA